MTQSDRHALVVRGGWSGHQPVEITELFVPFLEKHGFSVRIEDSPRIYADVDYMPMVDLIVQSVSRSTIEMQQFDGLRTAVEAGAGMAGWHGGITASYRNTAQYSHMIGAEFVEHPGKHPDERTGEESDSYVPHAVNITELGRRHPITQGIRRACEPLHAQCGRGSVRVRAACVLVLQVPTAAAEDSGHAVRSIAVRRLRRRLLVRVSWARQAWRQLP